MLQGQSWLGGGGGARKRGRFDANGGRGGRDDFNALKMLTFTEMCMGQDLEDRIDCPLQVGPGTGPSAFAEQGVRVVTVLPIESLSIRAKHPEECVFGNWKPGVDPNKAYTVQKSEILCSIINSEEYGPRWMDNAQGNQRRMYPQVFSSFTNFKEGLDYKVVGAARNPGAGRSQIDNPNDKSIACQLGGTITSMNSGAYDIFAGDHVYHLKQAWTQVMDPNDPTGRLGFTSMCPMKGIDRSKLLGQLVPLGPFTILQFLSNQYKIVNHNMKKDLFYDFDAKKPRGVPQPLMIKNFIESETIRMKSGVQCYIPNLILLVQLHILQELITHCMCHALETQNDANQNGRAMQDLTKWKELVKALYVLLAEHLKAHFTAQSKKLPHHLSSVAWQKKLPIVMDYNYEADKAFQQFPPSIKHKTTHLQHILTGTKIVVMEILRGIFADLSNKFVGTAISGAKKGFPVDLDLKRM